MKHFGKKDIPKILFYVDKFQTKFRIIFFIIDKSNQQMSE